MLFPVFEAEDNVFTVSELNRQIKGLLESRYGSIWVRGEISNFRVPGSGHCYFTLKDEQSQVRAVLFRSQQQRLRFVPEAGMQVICLGRLSVYEPRGEYQLIIDVMEPQGIGALQLAFEQLKKKLEAEGLFDPARKLPLPRCPQRIAIVTSPTGAAVRDMLKVLRRAPFNVSVSLLPVRVQGGEAAGEIAAAIAAANQLSARCAWDVLLVGRGGGSLEDLWPFNEEVVARAVAASAIPVISAVGHEIDFTICDMVSDLRVPTPTAAAEWVVNRLEDFQRTLLTASERLLRAFTRKTDAARNELRYLEKRLVHPKRRIEDLKLSVDDRAGRLQLAMARRLERFRTLHTHLAQRLLSLHPAKDLLRCRVNLDQCRRQLLLNQQKLLDVYRYRLRHCASQLESLSPLAVLSRGYSITYGLPGKNMIRKSTEVRPGQEVLVQLSEGHLECTVRKTDRDGGISS
ncbi:MAG: exodeoxyribonuclease VII large subunit [Syntrophobacteraceae bacterium]|nr:exodeoxyribonuclease VII large subunit [Desulfobacteraceae bacterium]